MHMNTAHHLELLWRFDRGLPLKEIIFATVKKGDLVVDAGCGTGLLSLWAAQAGASKVIGVDMGDLTVGRQLADENGFGDTIEFINGDLNQFTLPEGKRCDVLLAMVYFNDPRRDYAQTRLSLKLRERIMKPEGIQIPNRIEYTVHPLEWPSQELQTRFASMDVRMKMIESRYGLSLQGLLGRSKEMPDRTWFPSRLPSGLLDRTDARVLRDKATTFCDVDYSKMLPKYPQSLEIEFTSGGSCNALLFNQSLYYNNHLIFSNESLSWVVNPHVVAPGQKASFRFEDSWLVTSYTTMSKPD